MEKSECKRKNKRAQKRTSTKNNNNSEVCPNAHAYGLPAILPKLFDVRFTLCSDRSFELRGCPGVGSEGRKSFAILDNAMKLSKRSWN
jgi:hypothetical protein